MHSIPLFIKPSEAFGRDGNVRNEILANIYYMNVINTIAWNGELLVLCVIDTLSRSHMYWTININIYIRWMKRIRHVIQSSNDLLGFRVGVCVCGNLRWLPFHSVKIYRDFLYQSKTYLMWPCDEMHRTSSVGDKWFEPLITLVRL